MVDFGFLSSKDDSAVEDLISQAKDLYVLEQVAAINCSSFTDSSLPTNLETRFRRLKSLPVSSSSSSKSFSISSSFSGNPAGKSRPLDSSVEDSRIFPGIKPKRSPSVDSREKTQPLELLHKDIFRMSSSSFTSIDLNSPTSSSNLNRPEERSNRKLKFDKLLPSQAIGCLWPYQTKSSPNTKRTKNKALSSIKEILKKAKKAIKVSQREAFKLVKR